MKILFFIHGLYGGGAERVASILLNHFCEKHETYVAIYNFKAHSYPIDSRVHIIDDRKKKYSRFTPQFLKMANTIKRIDPDIIISFIVKENNRALGANLFFRKKIIVSERITLNRKKSLKHRILRRLLYPFADKIVFVTKDDCQKFGLSRKSLTIYNPAILLPYTNYSNRNKTIITIATQSRWYSKGLDVLLKAWGKIASQNPDWDLKIYGRIDGELSAELTKLPQERVTWAGWTDNIAEALQTASIFILTSRFEGCPNSLIEAMSQGCVCVGTNCDGGIKEIINDGINGLIIQKENVDDTAQKLQTLINDEQLRRELSSGAIEKAKQFDKKVFFERWDKLIDNIVKK